MEVYQENQTFSGGMGNSGKKFFIDGWVLNY